jgi:hypothetical protein
VTSCSNFSLFECEQKAIYQKLMIDTSELFVLAATIGSDPTDVGSLTFLFFLNTLAADRYPGTNFTGTGPDLGDTFEYSTPICTAKVQSDAQTNTKAQNYVKCGADFPDDISQEVTQDIFDEHQDIRNTVTGHTNKLSEYHRCIQEKGKRSIGTSDEVHDLSNQSKMSGLPIETVATSIASSDYTDSGKEDAHVQEQHTEDNSAEASDSTSLVCDFAQKNEAKSQEIGTPSTEGSIRHVASSGESSAIGRTEVEDESSFTSEVSAEQYYLSCVVDDDY